MECLFAEQHYLIPIYQQIAMHSSNGCALAQEARLYNFLIGMLWIPQMCVHSVEQMHGLDGAMCNAGYPHADGDHGTLSLLLCRDTQEGWYGCECIVTSPILASTIYCCKREEIITPRMHCDQVMPKPVQLLQNVVASQFYCVGISLQTATATAVRGEPAADDEEGNIPQKQEVAVSHPCLLNGHPTVCMPHDRSHDQLVPSQGLGRTRIFCAIEVTRPPVDVVCSAGKKCRVVPVLTGLYPQLENLKLK